MGLVVVAQGPEGLRQALDQVEGARQEGHGHDDEVEIKAIWQEI